LTLWDGNTFAHYKELNGRGILEDQEGNIWIGSATWGDGFKKWNGHEYYYYSNTNGLKYKAVRTLFQDRLGKIWISTYDEQKVLSVWDEKGFRHITVDDGLAINAILVFMQDRSGNIWMGGFEGISVLMRDGITRFDYKKKSSQLEHFDDSPDGKIWISQFGQGIFVWEGHNEKTGKAGFSHYTTNEGLSSNHIAFTSSDHSGRKWITSFNGLQMWDGIGFTHYSNLPGIGNIDAKDLLIDRKGKIWMGTWQNGLAVWDGIGFELFTTKEGLTDNNVRALLEDREGKLWIGTVNGLNVWDKNRSWQYTIENGLSGNAIYWGGLLEDKDGKIWISIQGGGLNVWDGKGFMHYTTEEGLCSNYIHGIYQDKRGDIWIGTNRGLNRIRKNKEDKTLMLDHYTNADGIGGGGIYLVCVDQSDQLWVSTNKVLNRLDLNLQVPDTTHPNISIQDLQLFYDFIDWRKIRDAINIGDNPMIGEQKLPLTKVAFDSVEVFKNLPANPSFPYNINQFTLSWQGIHWLAPQKLQYSYILEGKDELWSPLLKENKITYTDIRPGDYVFKVRAVGGNGKWSDTASYVFTIRPPLWATPWAYLFYGLCAVGTVLFLGRYEKRRFILKEKARTLEEIDHLKTEFFTNISHEFRTPLTLIQGPVKSIYEGTFKGDQKTVMGMILRNSRRLLRLINQLLDLSKLESGSLKLNASKRDIVKFVKLAAANFESAAVEKQVTMRITCPDDPVYSWFDPEKLERVIFNLIGNALKFTPKGGKIDLIIKEANNGFNKSEFKNGVIEINVRDTGIGISKKELDRIFDRFYQIDSSHQRGVEGTGIGLALARELVKLHHGEIRVESEEGWGTAFSILLPKGKDHLSEDEIASVSFEAEPTTEFHESATIELDIESTDTESLETANDSNQKLPMILIVEDNADMRQYIRSCIGIDYLVKEAANGKEGLETAIKEVPDMILSDVMMPEMDGFELCKKIRENETTRHIPLILLTAKADQGSRISGLKRGAVDYLVKPFDEEELRLKIKNQLDQLTHYRSYFSKQLVMNGGIEKVESMDDQFMKKAFSIVEAQ
ncbi:MAG: response regulator, partial [Cyclobacteriaceae bacterium]|nr:response regulator [Cyclobacteriaceae bacterium]